MWLPPGLLLTPCREGSFSCDDARCVALAKRCDLIPDCIDASDEQGCQLAKVGGARDEAPKSN